MNNDKLLIIVVVLTIYLLCFKKSEGQEICQYDEKKIQETVARMFKTGVDSSGNFSTDLTLNKPLKIVGAFNQLIMGPADNKLYIYSARDDDIYITDYNGHYNHEMDPWTSRTSP